MTVDNTKTNYSSEWDIDQLAYQGEVDGIVLPGSTSSATTVSLFTHPLGYAPVVDGTFQTFADTVWRQMGDSTSSGIINLETFITSTPISVNLVYYNFNLGDITVNVRYYVWTDKVIQ